MGKIDTIVTHNLRIITL